MKSHSVAPKNYLASDRGSLSILTISLFFLLVLVTFVIVETTHVYLAKKQLVQFAEMSVTRASHAIDLGAYYKSQLMKGSRVPIDCSSAGQILTSATSLLAIQGSSIELDSFNCDNQVLTASFHTVIPRVINFPLFGSGGVTIKSQVAAVSQI